MAKKTYETLMILDSNHYARDPGGVAKQIEQVIADAGGEVQVSRMWMEQKLAYPIDGHQKGTYWLLYFDAEGTQLPAIERAFQLAEPVVRELTIRLDPRLVEPILANARGQRAPVEPDADGGPAGELEPVAAAENE
ncbi:MAG: 30S ribosomal protein S6 [Planctomycetota bacterium]